MPRLVGSVEMVGRRLQTKLSIRQKYISLCADLQDEIRSDQTLVHVAHPAVLYHTISLKQGVRPGTARPWKPTLLCSGLVPCLHSLVGSTLRV